MKCYHHHDRDAFGICNVCGKGLCLECMEKTTGLIHCKNDKVCKSKAIFCIFNKVFFTILLFFIVVFIITVVIGPIK